MKKKLYSFLLFFIFFLSMLTNVIGLSPPTNPISDHVFVKNTYNNGINFTWTDGLNSDGALLVIKNGSYPDNIDDGYKFFINNSVNFLNFTGPFRHGLAFNKNISMRLYGGNEPVVPYVVNLEDGHDVVFMDNYSHDIGKNSVDGSPYFSMDDTGKVNGSHSVKFADHAFAPVTGNITGIRHFENDGVLDKFWIHCLMDYQDNTMNDVVLRVTPYNISGETKNVTFYFNAYKNSLPYWNFYQNRVVDGYTTGNHYSYTTETVLFGTHQLISSSYDGRNDGRITKVEIRAKTGYVGSGDIKPSIDITPIYENINGTMNRYQTTTSVTAGGEWTPFYDITTDFESPLFWSWSDLDKLKCNITAYEYLVSGQTNADLACYQVEYRVTYNDYRSDLPDVIFYDNGNVKCDNVTLMSNWVINRVYNITYETFQDSLNVSINDYHGNISYHNYSSQNEESYITGDDDNDASGGDIDSSVGLLGQTFTVDNDFVVEKIRINASRLGLPGDMVVSIRDVSDVNNWEPVGYDLVNATYDADNLPNYILDRGDWVNISFNESYMLSNGETYAIVVYVPNGGGGKYVEWRCKKGSASYSDGEALYTDSGNWERYTIQTTDFMFEIWGLGTSLENNIDGFEVSQENNIFRNVYLDNWTEVNYTSISTTNNIVYNWTYSYKPLNLTETNENTVVYDRNTGKFVYDDTLYANLSWNPSHWFYGYDQVMIRKSNSSYPDSISSGDLVYFGSSTNTSDVIKPGNTTYYSVWGYNNATGLYSPTYSTISKTASQLLARFTISPTYPRQNDYVLFRDQSTGIDIISYKWTFGDGDIAYGKHVRHKYEMGSYRPTLEIEDVYGNTDRFSKNIFIDEPDIPYIPPPEPNQYAEGYEAHQVYEDMNVMDIKKTDNEIIIVIIDTGYTSRVYNGVDMRYIEGYKLPIYDSFLDDNGHGTFCAYEIAYITQQKIPNAKIISFKAFDKNGESSAQGFLDALEYVKQLKPDVVSISAGVIGSSDDIFSKKIKELRDSGIIVIASSAGNRGPGPGTILSPACSDDAIAIGSYDPIKMEVNEWSSRGPVPNVPDKPDIVAPGESIRGPWMMQDSVKSGTSMSAPFVAGATAVIVARHKPLINTVKIFYFWDQSVIGDAYEDALKEGSTTMGDVNSWGAGIPDFEKIDGLFFMKLVILLVIPIALIAASIIIFIIWRYDLIYRVKHRNV